MPTPARGNQFVNCGIYSGILATDSGPGQSTKKRKRGEAPGESSRRRCREIQKDRDIENFVPALLVRQIAKNKRTRDRPSQVNRSTESQLRIAQAKRIPALQNAGQ